MIDCVVKSRTGKHTCSTEDSNPTPFTVLSRDALQVAQKGRLAVSLLVAVKGSRQPRRRRWGR